MTYKRPHDRPHLDAATRGTCRRGRASRRRGTARGSGRCGNGVAECYADMGQNDRAITLLEKAWAFLEAAGDPGFDLMRTSSNMAWSVTVLPTMGFDLMRTRSNMPRNLAP